MEFSLRGFVYHHLSLDVWYDATFWSLLLKQMMVVILKELLVCFTFNYD